MPIKKAPKSTNRGQLSDAGVTILELLLAATILVIILGAMAAFMANGRRANAASEAVTDRQQTIQTAINLFRYELSLSGYRGTCNSASTRTFAEPSFSITRGTTSDSITVRYYEDRWPATACGALRRTTLYVNEAESVLYMQRDSEPAVPALNNVDSFKLVNYLDIQGGRATELPATGFIGLDIRLNYEDPIGSFSQFVVGVKNPQFGAQEN